MRNSPVYYGWFVLAASAVSEMLVQGATSYSAGLFVLPLQAEFHISRAVANLPVLILFAGAMLVAPLAGRALDTRSIRLVVPVGAILLAASFAGIAATHSLAVMAVILVFPAAIAFMAAGPLNTSTLASRWFYRRRGLAQGFAAVATSAGGFTVVPLLSAAIQRHGWRPALFYEGVIESVIIVVLALLVLRNRPSDLGLQDHPENQDRPANVPAAERLGWGDILFSRAFWIPCLTLAAISGTCQAIVITLVPYGVQLGMTPVAAALPISVFAIVAAITKVVAGLLADRINQRCLVDRGGARHDGVLVVADRVGAAARAVCRRRPCGRCAGLRLADDRRSGRRQFRFGPFWPGDGLGLCPVGRTAPVVGDFCRRHVRQDQKLSHSLFGLCRAAGRHIASGHHGCARPQDVGCMTIAGLIAELESRSILLSLDGDQIRYRSPKQAVTDADRDALRARRGEIMDYLNARTAARGLRAASPTAGP